MVRQTKYCCHPVRCIDPYPLIPRRKTGIFIFKLQFIGMPRWAMRARCSRFRYFPNPLGIVSAVVKLQFVEPLRRSRLASPFGGGAHRIFIFCGRRGLFFCFCPLSHALRRASSPRGRAKGYSIHRAGNSDRSRGPKAVILTGAVRNALPVGTSRPFCQREKPSREPGGLRF